MTHDSCMSWAQHLQNVSHVLSELLQCLADIDIRTTEFSCLLDRFTQVCSAMLTTHQIELLTHQLNRYMRHSCEVCEDPINRHKLNKFKKQMHRLVHEITCTFTHVVPDPHVVSLFESYHDHVISCMQYRLHKQFLQESVQHAQMCMCCDHLSRLIGNCWINDRINQLCE